MHATFVSSNQGNGFLINLIKIMKEYSRPLTSEQEFVNAGLTKVSEQEFVNNTDKDCVIESWRQPSGTYSQMVIPRNSKIIRAVSGDKYECGVYLVTNA